MAGVVGGDRYPRDSDRKCCVDRWPELAPRAVRDGRKRTSQQLHEEIDDDDDDGNGHVLAKHADDAERAQGERGRDDTGEEDGAVLARMATADAQPTR